VVTESISKASLGAEFPEDMDVTAVDALDIGVTASTWGEASAGVCFGIPFRAACEVSVVQTAASIPIRSIAFMMTNN
jgi:hypothetical protein